MAHELGVGRDLAQSLTHAPFMDGAGTSRCAFALALAALLGALRCNGGGLSALAGVTVSRVGGVARFRCGLSLLERPRPFALTPGACGGGSPLQLAPAQTKRPAWDGRPGALVS